MSVTTISSTISVAKRLEGKTDSPLTTSRISSLSREVDGVVDELVFQLHLAFPVGLEMKREDSCI